jgi:peptidoglycan/xylan/chitin deacetylase (PgdA/CDA1 family)
MKGAIPILCYHKCGPVAEEGRRLNVEPATLARHIAFLTRRYRLVLPRDLAQGFPERAACVTFDDGYVSTLTHGLETLRGSPAAVYVCPALLGGASTFDPGHERPLAGPDLIRQAQRAGWEIGNHTPDHADLAALDEEAQFERLRAAQEALDALGFAPSTVAYPFGKHDERTLAAMARLGLPVGLALGHRPATPADNRRRLPRIVVAYGDGVARLLYKIHLRPRLPTLRPRPHYVP